MNCEICNSTKVIFMYKIDDFIYVPICQKCYEMLMKENSEIPKVFLTIDEYNAIQEIKGGAKGLVLTQ